jgi:hypothetical protein
VDVAVDRFGKLALEPDAVRRVTHAYEEALRQLGLNDVADTVTEEVARRIITLAECGVTDAEELAARAVKEIRAA